MQKRKHSDGCFRGWAGSMEGQLREGRCGRVLSYSPCFGVMGKRRREHLGILVKTNVCMELEAVISSRDTGSDLHFL